MIEKNNILIYFHYDQDDIIDDHVKYTLNNIRNFFQEIIFVHNGELVRNTDDIFLSDFEEVIIRKDEGRDWAGWRHALLKHRLRFQNNIDGVVLMNSSVYGPLFPIEDLFKSMSKKSCDFWTLTEWGSYNPDLLDVPVHFQPYILTIRKAALINEKFWEFWESLETNYRDYWDFVVNCEIKLTSELQAAGLKGESFAPVSQLKPLKDIGFEEPLSQNGTDYLIDKFALPFIKVKSFVANENRPFSIAPLILRSIKRSGSKYPTDLIYQHLRRTQPLSCMRSIAESFHIIDDISPISHKENSETPLNIAVVLHVYYADGLEKYISYLENIPFFFDLYVTLARPLDEGEVRRSFERSNIKKRSMVLRFVENRGRDVLPWMRIGDLSEYSAVLKIHVKKHSQQPEVFSHRWSNYILDNLCGSDVVVSKILQYFENDDELGICFCPYPLEFLMLAPNAFRGSVADQIMFNKAAELMGIKFPTETESYDFSVGTMFWYRPSALLELSRNVDVFLPEFPSEPLKEKATIAHGIERVIPYVAQASGYKVQRVLTQSYLLDHFCILQERILSKYVSTWDMVKKSGAKPKSRRKIFKRFGVFLGRLLNRFSWS